MLNFYEIDESLTLQIYIHIDVDDWQVLFDNQVFHSKSR